MTLQERADAMIDRYGEVVSFTLAAKILNRCPKTIRVMIDDGRLTAACGDTRVDVYSIAAYICEPARKDFEARVKKSGKTVSRWAV
mgnify:CR=1 FL=1